MEHLWFTHISKKRSPKEALDAEMAFAISKGFVCLRPFDSACKIIARREDALAARSAILSDVAQYATRLQDVYVLSNDAKDLMLEYRQLPAKLNVRPRIMKVFKVPRLQPEDIGTTRGMGLESSGFESSVEVEHATGETGDGTSLDPVDIPAPHVCSSFYNPATHWATDLTRATNALNLHTTRREALISLPTDPDYSESELAVSEADWGQPPEEEISEDLGVESSAGSSKDLPSSHEARKEMLVQKQAMGSYQPFGVASSGYDTKAIEEKCKEQLCSSEEKKEMLRQKLKVARNKIRFEEAFPSKTKGEIHQEKMERGEVAPPPPPEPKAKPAALSLHDRKENLIRRWSQTPRATKPKTDKECIVC